MCNKMKTMIFNHTPTDNDTLVKIQNSVSDYLLPKRYEHTLSVQKEALNIARIYFKALSIDEKYLNDISAAALLHDITKKLDTQEHLYICKEYGIEFDSETMSLETLHAKTGAYFAKQLFNINDIVFDAIFCHTTGKENMNIFDKIIFLSDYIESTRKQKPCIEVRNFFYDNLDPNNPDILLLDIAIIMSIDSTIAFLKSKNAIIDDITLKARNSLKIAEVKNICGKENI